MENNDKGSFDDKKKYHQIIRMLLDDIKELERLKKICRYTQSQWEEEKKSSTIESSK